ncbi:hypothetical protein F0562_021569 [Nyssa sinensis]|uniref:Uncharacterized protein n=1 Tax=Nyssa sinensis TaxID=561372 RepID=A0A5J5BKL3_9ASTE|nr:hypothetical protein F0562_021569 [Nyssa sinensis]
MALQWLSLVGIIWLQSINGTNSNFPAYSSQLKHLLSMSQLQLNNLAFASDAGKLFGWFSGIAAVHLPLWLVLMIGSLLGLIGYGMQYLFLANHISLSYEHVFLLTVLAGNSICWINTVCYIVTIQNFPLDRQVAVGLSTSYLGLSAKIYTDIVDALYPSSSPMERAKAYLLLNSILPLIVCFVAAPIVRNINFEKSRRLEGGLIVMFVITMATGTYAVISSTTLGSISSVLSPLIVVTVMGVFLLAPLVIPLAEQAMERLQKKCRIRRVYDLNIEEGGGGAAEKAEIEVKEGEGDVEIHDQGSVREEIGAKLMLKRVEFWLYFFVYLCGATLGLVFLNNLGQIAESRGYSRTSCLVSLSSSFGFFGRLIPSLLDYYLSRSTYHVVSRPASTAAMMAPMSVAFFLLLNKSNLSLYISTAIIGICTGAITSISISMTTDLFGTKNFSVNHNILVANIPIGSFLLGDLAALLYHKEAINGGDHGRCMGMECYQTTFIIWGSLCLLGTLLALILRAKTKKFYSQKL